MQRTPITPNTILTLADEMAGQVALAAGWPPITAPVNIRMMPPRQGYLYLVNEWLHALNLECCREHSRDLLERMVELVSGEFFLANYLPHTRELLVITGYESHYPLGAMRLALAHELVHRLQAATHPEIFERIDHHTRMILCAYFETPGSLDLYQFITVSGELNSLVTLVESHAAYIQNCLAKTSQPNTRSLPHCSLPGIIFRLLGENKSSRHISGLPAVAEAAAAGNLDALFRSPGKFNEHMG